MRAVFRRRPSGAMVVAILALVFAASGTAIAASKLVSGDKLIKKHSLSGNRLRNHTITGRQVNLAKLGKVRNARHADSATNATNAGHASSADTATTATNAGHANSATTATTAGNAATVGGQPPSAFEPAANWTRSGLVRASAGQTVPLSKFGPFALTLVCTDTGGGNIEADIRATSTEANSEAYNQDMPTPGTPVQILASGPSATPGENADNAADFFTPSGKTYIADLTVGENRLGSACYANSLASPS